MPASLTAIERYYTQRYAQILRVATAIVGDPELARDVVHDAFVSAIVSRDAVREEGSIEPWLWRVLTTPATRSYAGHGEPWRPPIPRRS